MNEEADTLPTLLARLSSWRTINRDESLLSAPAQIQREHLKASIVLSNLQEGEIDPWLGGKIHTIVRKSTKYIVYLDESLEIRWWWLTRVNEAVVNAVQARVNALEHESSFLLTQTPVQLNPWSKSSEIQQRQQARHIRSLIGEAMAVSLNAGTLADCEKVLAEAERQIAVIKDQQARPVFAGWFIAAVALLAAITATFYLGGKHWVAPDDLVFVRMWLEAGLSGAFGALISAITRTRTLQLEPAAGHRGLLIEAVSRALIGAGAGLLVFFALEAGLLQAALSDNREILRGMRLFICVAAGASERILPSLIGRAEGIVKTNDAKSDGAVQTTPSARTEGAEKEPPERAVG